MMQYLAGIWSSFMSSMSSWFVAPVMIALLPLIGVVIIFYFLKLKRPRQEISSLALWRQVINDQRVNSPFQKFKRNVLLLLQLLMLMFLILAAMQPFYSGGAERAQYLPVLIDCSASMAALDKPGGQTRLETAKEHVRELIDNMLTDQRLALIEVSSTARRVTDFTDNKRILHDALDQIEIANVRSKFEDALRMTQAMGRTKSIETAIVLSDGNVPPRIDFELPFQLNFQKLPAGGPNLGITAFNARRAKDSRWDVFVRIENSQHEQLSAAVQLKQNGAVAADDTLVLDPGQSQRIVFQVDSEGASALEVVLIPDQFDSLSSDNVAYIDLPLTRPLTVYAHLEMGAFRHALEAHREVALFPDDDGSRSASSYDLLITDRTEDARVDASVTLNVGMIPPDLQQMLTVETGLAEVVDWNRSSPILQHVQLLGVQIADEPRKKKDTTDQEFEQLGYDILAYGRAGPLILKRRVGQKLSFYLLFHTDRSTMPYRVGFPILVANAIRIAIRETGLAEVRAHSTGTLPDRKLNADETYSVVAPDGSKRDFQSNSSGLLSGIAAGQIGRYDIQAGGKSVASIGISLMAASESSLENVDEIQFKELSVAASETKLKSNRSLWPTLALIAFCLLLVEWWYFQRRPGGVTV